MSLFRIVVVLVVVVMILPIGNDDTTSSDAPAPQSSVSTGEFVDAAVSAAYDVSGICSRQPMVCSIGYELWTTFQRKSLYLAGYVYDWASGTPSSSSPAPLLRNDNTGIGNAPAAPATEIPDGSAQRGDRIDDPSNTLTQRDRSLPWRGPST